MGGPSQSTVNAQNTVAKEQADTASAANTRSQALYDTTAPGITTAENYYQTLAKGDPNSIYKAIAPAATQVSAASDAAKKNINDTMPRGGEKLLAMEQADIAKSSQIGNLLTQSYTSSFPALANLGGQGVGLSVNQMSNAIAALGGASNTYGNVAQEQSAGKAATMGFLGSLAGAGGEVGSAAAFACWIAEVLFGESDNRTKILRYWLNRDHYDSWFMVLYRRYGQRVAAILRKHPSLQWPFRLLFNRLLVCARRRVSLRELETI
jgi:hypothetical protein